MERIKNSVRWQIPIEKLKKGSSLYLNPYQGRGIKDFLKNILKQSDIEEEGKKAFKNILNNLSDGIEVREDSEGSAGLYLSPFKHRLN